MSNAKLKLKILEMIEEFEKNNLLQEVYDLLEAATSPLGDELNESQKQGLTEAIDELKAGEYFSYEEVRQGIRDKYNV